MNLDILQMLYVVRDSKVRWQSRRAKAMAAREVPRLVEQLKQARRELAEMTTARDVFAKLTKQAEDDSAEARSARDNYKRGRDRHWQTLRTVRALLKEAIDDGYPLRVHVQILSVIDSATFLPGVDDGEQL